ncbi:MAG: hypothetical protein ACLT98_13280 [Eggerthellaceae bacterium]
MPQEGGSWSGASRAAAADDAEAACRRDREHVNSIRRSIAAGRIPADKVDEADLHLQGSGVPKHGEGNGGAWRRRAPAERWWPGAGAGALAGAPGCADRSDTAPKGRRARVAATPRDEDSWRDSSGRQCAHTATGGASPWHR